MIMMIPIPLILIEMIIRRLSIIARILMKWKSAIDSKEAYQ